MKQAFDVIYLLWSQLQLRIKVMWLAMFLLAAITGQIIFLGIFQMHLLSLMTLRVYKNRGSELYGVIQALPLTKRSLKIGMYGFIMSVFTVYDACYLIAYTLSPLNQGKTLVSLWGLGVILLMLFMIGLTLLQLPSFVTNIYNTSQENADIELSSNRIGMIFLLIYAAGLCYFVLQLVMGFQVPFYLPIIVVVLVFTVIVTDSNHRMMWDILLSMSHS